MKPTNEVDIHSDSGHRKLTGEEDDETPRAMASVGLTYYGEETRLKANPLSTFATDYANHTDYR
eukprot:3971317-Pyramimonas_sp.AAC.1